MLVPTVTPVTPPVTAFTLTFPLLADHVPPPEASVRIFAKPWHIFRLPSIAVGSGFTVTISKA